MKPTLVYLASPYSHPDPNMRITRWRWACVAAAKLMQRGYCVFSPIAHSHPIATCGRLPIMDHDFWQKQDRPMLDMADRLVVLDMPFWNRSMGVVAEIKRAIERGIPVTLWRFGDKGLGKPLPHNATSRGGAWHGTAGHGPAGRGMARLTSVERR